jgi:hypothetical protein
MRQLITKTNNRLTSRNTEFDIMSKAMQLRFKENQLYYLKRLIQNNFKFNQNMNQAVKCFNQVDDKNMLQAILVQNDIDRNMIIDKLQNIEKCADIESAEQLLYDARVLGLKCLFFTEEVLGTYLSAIATLDPKSDENQRKLSEYILKVEQTSVYLLARNHPFKKHNLVKLIEFHLRCGDYGSLKKIAEFCTQSPDGSQIISSYALKIIELGILRNDPVVEQMYDILSNKPSLAEVQQHYDFCAKHSRQSLFDLLNKKFNNEFSMMRINNHIGAGDMEKTIAMYSSLENDTIKLKARFQIIDRLIKENNIENLQAFVDAIEKEENSESIVLNDILCSVLRSDKVVNADSEFKMQNLLSHPNFKLNETQILKNAVYMCEMGMASHVAALLSFLTEHVSTFQSDPTLADLLSILSTKNLKAEHRHFLSILDGQLNQKDFNILTWTKKLSELPLHMQMTLIRHQNDFNRENVLAICLDTHLSNEVKLKILEQLNKGQYRNSRLRFETLWLLLKTNDLDKAVEYVKENGRSYLASLFTFDARLDARRAQYSSTDYVLKNSIEKDVFVGFLRLLAKSPDAYQKNVKYCLEKLDGDFRMNKNLNGNKVLASRFARHFIITNDLENLTTTFKIHYDKSEFENLIVRELTTGKVWKPWT